MLMAFGGFLAVTDKRYRLTSRKQREHVEEKPRVKPQREPRRAPAAPVIAGSKKGA
jgi:cytochrome c-type biogenesis protein CcmF